ncbi:unnamed protein product [Somion occarium]|uniref:Hydrophobin n=1 Tax=Somion occarium TaxID=3059160 RepID=A0ABP1CW50_9APHY
MDFPCDTVLLFAATILKAAWDTPDGTSSALPGRRKHIKGLSASLTSSATAAHSQLFEPFNLPHSPNSFNMFSRLVAFVALASPLLAVATPAVIARNEPASDCSTAPIQCCDTVTKADSADAAGVLGALGIVLQDIDALVGLTCSPISVIGVGSTGCSASPVCCEDNSHGGFISIGCVPVDS